MIVVVDTNVVASAILRKSITQRILFNAAFRFYAPGFIWSEIAEHRKEFIEKTGYAEDEFNNAVYLAFSNLTIVPEEEYEKYRGEALSFSPDKDDWPFLALALHLNAPLWSFDKKLREKQERVKVISVEELLLLSK
jgi:predicted nucleic acid-binding protein